MLHYAHLFFNQVAQSAACNHFHSVEQRCCRWLLMTHDRVQSERFLLTQDFMGMMLGVRRKSVTAAASMLKRRNLITYRRGQVTILNRTGIEQCVCECYAVSRQEFDRLLGYPLGSSAAQVNNATSKNCPHGVGTVANQLHGGCRRVNKSTVQY